MHNMLYTAHLSITIRHTLNQNNHLINRKGFFWLTVLETSLSSHVGLSLWTITRNEDMSVPEQCLLSLRKETKRDEEKS